jgi:hypothetical protein
MTQLLWCARCRTAFIFTGARVERTEGGKLAVRHLDCGALNELALVGRDPDGNDTYRVVGVVAEPPTTLRGPA